MKSKEVRDIIIKEIVKECLIEKGYKRSGPVYYSEREDCFLVINIQNSQFNSEFGGYNFWLNINTVSKDIPKKEFKNFYSGPGSIRDNILLTDGGLLHPYRNVIGFHIGGYKDGKVQDINIEKIKNLLKNDFQQEILPKLAEINTFSDWERKKQEWEEKLKTPRMMMISFFIAAQSTYPSPEFIPQLQRIQKTLGINPAKIRANEDLYQQVRALSDWPSEDKWQFVLSALLNE